MSTRFKRKRQFKMLLSLEAQIQQANMCKIHYTLKHGEEAFWKEEFNCSFRSLHLFTKWLSIKESNFTKYNKHHQMHISTTPYRLYTKKLSLTLKYTLKSWHVTYKAPTLFGPLPCTTKSSMNKTHLKLTRFSSTLCSSQA
jgi:hypothetical protein